MATFEPFAVYVTDDELDQLKQKLSTATFPDELEDAGWDYGTPLKEVKRLATYWKNHYSWKKEEAKINALPNFRTTIQADGFEPLKIHFVHQQSRVDEAIPLLFVHGCMYQRPAHIRKLFDSTDTRLGPGNFLEVSKLLLLLAEPRSGKHLPAFHIVAPSLPNFGFSEGTKKRGFGLAQYAETLHKLMQKLGYQNYVTQGGDWGCMITRAMGKLYPDSCMASHINMPRGSRPKYSSNPILALRHSLTPYTKYEQEGLARTQWFLKEGSGYRTQQATKPQTLNYLLADSPVGLLAWIYEKLHDWTDDYKWTDDEVLTWVSVYWFSTAGVGAAQRIYYEAVKGAVSRNMTEEYIPHVKLGLAFFPKELTVYPRTWARTLGPVVYESVNDKGGHFAATERPDVIASDLQKMFGKGGGAYKVIPGKSGYESTAKL